MNKLLSLSRSFRDELNIGLLESHELDFIDNT